MTLLDFPILDARVTGLLHADHDRLAAHKTRPALIVCPGGGYDHLSPREGEAPAMAFFAAGYNVFILHYSVGERAGELRPFRELAQTVSHVREHAERWHIRPDCIAVMGFSAGGHLAASLGAWWQTVAPECKPNALVLGYPVITMGEFTHRGTREHVTAGNENLNEMLSIENSIKPTFPPCFVWGTVDDASVPMENSLLLVSALRRAGVPFEYHLFAHGEHGLSTCTQETETPNPECAKWLELSQTWLNKQFGFAL